LIYLSLNELKFACRWAALGALAQPGLADDLARAAVNLASIGLNPAAAVIPALKSLKEDHVWGQLQVQQEGQRLTISSPGALPTIELGPVLGDAAEVAGQENNIDELRVGEVVMPILLAGYLQSAARSTPGILSWQGYYGTVAVRFDHTGITAIHANEDTNIYATRGASVSFRQTIGETLDLRFSQAQISAAAQSALQAGVPVSEEEWTELQALASKAWVKSTEQSRLTGAGAGLFDRD